MAIFITPGGGTPGGSTTQVQFNDAGAFAGDADLTWDKTTNVLGITGDVNLSDGGTYTTTLQTITPTAARTISFPDATGTVALVGGSSGQLLWNNAGAVGGASTLTYDGSILTTSGRFINSYNATASAPAKSFVGTWFTGGTAATTKPQVLIEPTGATSTAWSTSGTGLGVNAPAAFAGNLLDLQVNGTSQFYIASNGNILTTGSLLANTINPTSGGFFLSGNSVRVTNLGYFGFSSTSAAFSTADVTLYRDAANTLAQRNGTNAQAFRLYNTYTDSSNYERHTNSWSGNVLNIANEAAGTGTLRSIAFSANAAASTPPVTFTGTWFTGGTATTTKPQVVIEPTGTTSTGWSTAGTALGVNASSGFAGNLLDLQLNGTSRAVVTGAGFVGIGTSLPSTRLDVGGIFKVDTATGQTVVGANNQSAQALLVQGNSASGTRIDIANTATNGRRYALSSNQITGNGEFGIYDFTAEATRLVIDSSGRLGIGTSTAQSDNSLLNIACPGPGSGDSVMGGGITTATNSFRTFEWGMRVDGVGPKSAINFRLDPGSGGSDSSITFITNRHGIERSERMRIDSSGRVLVGTSTANTSGAKLQTSDGLTFPATQVASTNPNTLDDYEEGTSYVYYTTTGGTFTNGGTTLVYTKIGNVVYCRMGISAATTSPGTGDITIAGLPFVVSTAGGTNSTFVADAALGVVQQPLTNSFATQPFCVVPINNTATLKLKPSGSSGNYMTATAFSSTTNDQFNWIQTEFWYHV